MNQERPNEIRAKKIVERVMGIDLVHADTHGGVDYLSHDGAIALEVTAVTAGENVGARKALGKSIRKGAPHAPLQACWSVSIAEGQSSMKTFIQRVQPAIAELELAGETSFYEQHAAVHVLQNGPLSHLYRPLLEAGVEGARCFPHAADPGHTHKIFTLAGGGGSVRDSDQAVDELTAALRQKPDNPRKLRATRARQRHLFVWLNFDTPYNIARPLQHEEPSWAGGNWGTPTTPPQLDPSVTHLWIAHEGSGRGWVWNGASWSEFTDEA